jgi:hypothetical protein
MSANATASSVVTPTGIVTNGSAIVTSVSSITGVTVSQAIAGAGIPAGAQVLSTTATTITMSVTATASSGSATALTIATTEALSTPAPVTVTVTGVLLSVGATAITLATNATLTVVNPLNITVPVNTVATIADNFDVAPADIGAGAATGPAFITGSVPAAYQGFFNTAGSATSSANNPAGFVFARSFQQILAVLYNYNQTTSIVTTQNYFGGFFPVSAGVAGPINSAI